MLRQARLQLSSLLGNRAIRLKWAVFLSLSGLFVLALQALRLPAALLLGPMAAAILLAVAGGARE
jgi:uncharacterized protein